MPDSCHRRKWVIRCIIRVDASVIQGVGKSSGEKNKTDSGHAFPGGDTGPSKGGLSGPRQETTPTDQEANMSDEGRRPAGGEC